MCILCPSLLLSNHHHHHTHTNTTDYTHTYAAVQSWNWPQSHPVGTGIVGKAHQSECQLCGESQGTGHPAPHQCPPMLNPLHHPLLLQHCRSLCLSGQQHIRHFITLVILNCSVSDFEWTRRKISKLCILPFIMDHIFVNLNKKTEPVTESYACIRADGGEKGRKRCLRRKLSGVPERRERKRCNLKHEETEKWVEGRMNYDLSMH